MLLGAGSMTATAQQATQSVTIVVEEVNNLAVVADVVLPATSEHPAPESAVAPDATYAFSTNGFGKKITGQLGARGTTDLSLDVALAAPAASGSSVGSRTLDRANAMDLVTGLSSVTQSGLGVRYTVSSTAGTDVPSQPGEPQTVTFTMTDR